MHTSRTTIGLFVLTTLVVLALASRSAAQTLYNATALGTLGGGQSEAYALNDYNQVVGRALDANSEPHVFHWQNGEMVALYHELPWGRIPLPRARYTVAYGISNTDHIVSYIMETSDQDASLLIPSAVIYRPAVMSDLTTPYPGEAITRLGFFCSPTDISANGLYAVGWGNLDCTSQVFAFLVTPTGGGWYAEDASCSTNAILRNLGTLQAIDVNSSATAVNDNGVVVGWSYSLSNGYEAFVLEPAVDIDGNPTNWFVDDGTGANALMTSLGTLPSTDGQTFGHNSWARGINNAGIVVGEADTGDFQTHAFVWHAGTLIDLGSLGGASSSAAAINDDGVIVGWSLNAAGYKRAFILTPQDTDEDGEPDLWYIDEDEDGVNDLMLDLNTLLPSGFALLLTEGRDINRHGAIVGWGTAGTASGADRLAFLLTPRAATDAEEEGGTDGGTGVVHLDLMPIQPTGTPGGTDGDQDGTGGIITPGGFGLLCGPGTLLAVPLSLLGLGVMMRRRPVRHGGRA
jgi:probable HAF family extracellular repeat protein